MYHSGGLDDCISDSAADTNSVTIEFANRVAQQMWKVNK